MFDHSVQHKYASAVIDIFLLHTMVNLSGSKHGVPYLILTGLMYMTSDQICACVHSAHSNCVTEAA